MKVVIAIDSFKGSVSSMEGSREIALGIKEIYPNADIVSFPIADGGEGTVEALVYGTGGQLQSVKVTGPLMVPVQATYGITGNGKTAVIEVAAACGLPLVPEASRNPMLTTTHGVGELIAHAIGQGCREFIIGLGGSATNDAGVGMLQALGYRFKDQEGNDVGTGGNVLSKIHRIDSAHVHPELRQCEFKILPATSTIRCTDLTERLTCLPLKKEQIPQWWRSWTMAYTCLPVSSRGNSV